MTQHFPQDDTIWGVIRQMQREIERLKRASRLPGSSIYDGAITVYDENENPVQVIGKQSDNTFSTVVLDGPTPPAPEAPVVTPAAGGLLVGWNGVLVENAPLPSDFSRVAIHISDTEDFTPNETTLVATVEAAMEGPQVYVPLPPEERYVKLMVHTLAGKVSEPSEEVAETALPIVDVQEVVDEVIAQIPVGGNTITYAHVPPNADGEANGDTWYQIDTSNDTVVGVWRWDTDAGGVPPNPVWIQQTLSSETIDTITAGQITTGFLSAGVQIAAGNPTGARTELDASGLRHYDSLGVEDVNLSTAGAVFSGRVVGADIIGSSYRTAVSGNRVEIDTFDYPFGEVGVVRFIPSDADGVAGTLESSTVNGPEFSLKAPPGTFSFQTFTGGQQRVLLQAFEELFVSTKLGSESAEWWDRFVSLGLPGGSSLNVRQRPIYSISNVTNRNALAAQAQSVLGSAAFPLFVWRQNISGPNKLEVTLDGVTWTPVGPARPMFGSVTFPPASYVSGGISDPITITFPLGRFTSPPTVIPTINSFPGGSAYLVPRAINVTQTSASLYLVNVGHTTTTHSSSIIVRWVADGD